MSVISLDQWRVVRARRFARVFALLIALALAFMCGLASAECRHYVRVADPHIDLEGEGSAACNALLAGVQAASPSTAYSLSSCAAVSGGVAAVIAWPGDSYTWYATDEGACASAPEPPASAASSATNINVTVQLQLPAWLDLSAEDGLLLAAAIVGVWAAAFSWRAAIKALGSDNDGDSST